MEYRPIADWLVAARESQIDKDTGEAWTQPKFLEELEAATGWHLHRSNLSAYENGRQIPKKPTLDKFIAFWKSKGIDGPDLSPPKPPSPPVDPLIVALEAQTKAISELARQVKALVEREPGEVAAAVALAVRDTLLDVGVVARLPRP